VLQREGHVVTIASDGEQALALLFAETFEVAVIDIGLPGIDGFEVARLTRERLGGAAPLLVAMTGFGGPRGRDASERAGFDAHLVKPVEPAVLVAMIATSRARVLVVSEQVVVGCDRIARRDVDVSATLAPRVAGNLC
jgi:CheY-like chemotaxis protein